MLSFWRVNTTVKPPIKDTPREDTPLNKGQTKSILVYTLYIYKITSERGQPLYKGQNPWSQAKCVQYSEVALANLLSILLHCIFPSAVGFTSGRMNSYYNQDFTVDLRRAKGGAILACDIEYFAIIDTDVNERLTKIIISQDAFVSESFFLSEEFMISEEFIGGATKKEVWVSCNSKISGTLIACKVKAVQ